MGIKSEDIFVDILSVLVPESLSSFELVKVKEYKNYITERFTYKEKKNSNGETLLEFLARSRYFSYKY